MDYLGTFLQIAAIVLFICPAPPSCLAFPLCDADESPFGSQTDLPRRTSSPGQSHSDFCCHPLLGCLTGVFACLSGHRKKGEVLATLLIGLFIFPVFFWWQTKVDPIDALIKPRTWSASTKTSSPNARETLTSPSLLCTGSCPTSCSSQSSRSRRTSGSTSSKSASRTSSKPSGATLRSSPLQSSSRSVSPRSSRS